MGLWKAVGRLLGSNEFPAGASRAVEDETALPAEASAARGEGTQSAAEEDRNRGREANESRAERPSVGHFLIRDPIEIVAILRAAARASVPVNVSFGGETRDSYRSVIVAIEPDAERFAIDPPQAAELRERLLGSADALVEFEVRQVRHRLTAAAPRAGKDAQSVTLALPEELLRYQQREYFRIEVGHGSRAKCRVRLPGQKVLDLALVDVSVGGLSVRFTGTPPPALAVGALLAGTELELPDLDPIAVTVEVRNLVPLATPGASPATRIGLRLVKPSPAQLVLIQRYINALQAQAARCRE